MAYSIEEITTQIGAHRLGTSKASIDWMLTDSRSLAFPETTLFFALKTARNDGHRYIPDLYRRGVRNFVVSTVPQNHEPLFPNANFLKVISPLKALQRLAERHREEFSIPVIGITGSNGKTMVKEWLYQLLAPSFDVITRSPRSYNSQIGVPLSVLLLNGHSSLGIFEAGISQPDEMEALRDIIQPTIGIMTCLGSAHQEQFESLEAKCREKMSLFKDCELLIYNADDSVISKCVNENFLGKNQLAWSEKDVNAPLFISKIQKNGAATTISYSYPGYDSAISIPFIDDASVTNAIHCLAACLYLHIPSADIAARMTRLEPLAMRLEVKEGRHGCTIINDSYNNDINSLEIALDFMNRRPDSAGKSRTLILSDIEQSGQSPRSLYAEVAPLLEKRGINRLIGVGADITAAADLFTQNRQFFPTTAALMESGALQSLSNDMVLIKGARHFNFEQVSDALSLKVHETTLEINLGAIVDNFNYYKSCFRNPGTKMVCMVKASAYGAGAIEISKTLQDHGVDYLAVAVADEGADLRKAGITSNILIMNPEMTAFHTMFEHRLEPEVYSFKLLEALIHAAEKEGITNFPIHVKLDTGMRRLGFDPENDMPALIRRLHSQSAVIPRSVFSHFAGSDSDSFDNFSDRQFALFDRASRMLQEAFPHKILRHICNSAGIERFPERQLDMVRLGLGLYGVDPCDNRILSNVSSLRTTILQIRDVQAGDTVGYSRKGVVHRPSRIAAIPIGYADGLNRHLGCGRGYCLINGQKAYYVGNICMDVCMIDVTDIECSEGDRVEIFGDNLPVTVLSDLLDTIPYEVLTSVSNRVKRIYFQD